MKKVEVVLTAIDFEDGSRAVLRRAAHLASTHAARLIVLHVIEDEQLSHAAHHMKRDESELRKLLQHEAVTAVEALVAKGELAQCADVRVEFGRPYEVIKQVMVQLCADVVVIGPGKGSTLKDKFLGSIADRVIRMSSVPVLVARESSVKPYQNVAVAVDDSPQAASAFAEARRLVPGATFQLVRAVDIPFTFQQSMLRAGTTQADMKRYRVALVEKAREKLYAFQQDSLGAAESTIEILNGEPGSALVRFSKNSHVDLLALGTHGRGVVLQAFLGSVAQYVLGRAACDVLVTST